MKYKLLENEWTENFDDAITHILLNRGFAPSEISAYLNADDSCINNYDSLSSLIFDLNEIEGDDDLEQLAIELSEFNYYNNQNK